MSQIKVEYINHCGDDLSVVDAARCSFDKKSDWEYICDGMCFTCDCAGNDKKLKSSDEKLINYLASHKHFSPFNHSFISVRVKAPVFVARQLVKHKFMPWNEVSRRYVKGEVEFYTPDSWRKAAENVKQGSSFETIPPHRMSFSSDTAANYLTPSDVNDVALEVYTAMIEEGVCAEQARQVLPQSMMTTWIWSGTLGAFCDMLVLRLDSHTQYETRLVAQQVAEIVKELFPVSYKALVGEK
jgi:thymidylate synthase (FAD)